MSKPTPMPYAYIVSVTGGDLSYFTVESDGDARGYRARLFAREESTQVPGPVTVYEAADVDGGARTTCRRYESGEAVQ